jgi:hypothetical protein
MKNNTALRFIMLNLTSRFHKWGKFGNAADLLFLGEVTGTVWAECDIFLPEVPGSFRLCREAWQSQPCCRGKFLGRRFYGINDHISFKGGQGSVAQNPKWTLQCWLRLFPPFRRSWSIMVLLLTFRVAINILLLKFGGLAQVVINEELWKISS